MRLSRRTFLQETARGAGALAALGLGCSQTGGGGAGAPRRAPVAFNTANLVARVTGYRFELRNWGEQHRKTVAATDEGAWTSICREIRAAGFCAVEVWEAHASPETMTAERARTWKKILDDHGLAPIGYGGRLSPETARICQGLGIPAINGGMGPLTPKAAAELCRGTGVRFNHENHPEKSVAEIRAKIDGGSEWLGVCVDTGWLGTQGVSAPEAIRALGALVRHTHVKDVKAAGAHATCLLGEGVVDVAGALRALRDIGYAGAYSWEDEPEDRNPFDSAARNRRWIEERVGA
jgi:sugar phosphate isomerase/epimerase